MEVKQLKIENLGRFPSVAVDFAPTPTLQSNVTVLIGNNGAGKTSILKSLATTLSWFVARVRSEKGSGNPIPEDVILNGTASAATNIVLNDASEQYQWTLAKTRTGRKGGHTSQLNDASRLADIYRSALSTRDTSSLPLIAFYSVERVVIDIPLKIKERHSFFQLDGYDNSLNQGVDFRRFFEWFREREDWENEIGVETAIVSHINKAPKKLIEALDFIKNSKNQIENLKEFDFEGATSILNKLSTALEVAESINYNSKDPQLNAVRKAIENFMPEFSNIKIRRKPRLHMSIDKDGQTLNVSQLSQGEKSLMALVGDIARRLAMMNPDLKEPLHGNGVVMIDEVDMHLHPKWARGIIERLTTTFPNCQFILSTHSPLVISDCRNVLVYTLDNGQLTEVPSQYGQDANTVLLEVMDTHIRNATVTKSLGDLLDLIQERKLVEAKDLLAKLEEQLPQQNLELAKARLYLQKEGLRRAKN